MAAKLTDSKGGTIFEFDDDRQMRALLLALIGQAKHGDHLRPELTLNVKLDELARALIVFAEREGHAGFKGADGAAPRPPRAASWSPPPSWAHAVISLVFEQAPSVKWWTLSTDEKRAIVAQAFFPNRLPDEAIEDYCDWIDFRIAQYRAGVDGPPSA